LIIDRSSFMTGELIDTFLIIDRSSFMTGELIDTFLIIDRSSLMTGKFFVGAVSARPPTSFLRPIGTK
jgi:hypothetical protein